MIRRCAVAAPASIACLANAIAVPVQSPQAFPPPNFNALTDAISAASLSRRHPVPPGGVGARLVPMVVNTTQAQTLHGIESPPPRSRGAEVLYGRYQTFDRHGADDARIQMSAQCDFVRWDAALPHRKEVT